MSEYLIPILIILLLVALNAVFVAAEFAIVAARGTRIETMAGGATGRFLLGVLRSPNGRDRFIAVAQLGITLASIGLGMYGEKTVASWLYGPLEHAGLGYAAAHTLGTVISLSFITYLHVVLGEMIPKSLALTAPERTSVSVAPAMRAFGTVFGPLVTLLNAVAFGLMRTLGIRDTGSGERLYTPDELEDLVRESSEGGQLAPGQAALLARVFEFDDTPVRDVMTPRVQVVALDAGASRADVLDVVRSAGHSRYPVMEGSLDRILGFVHIKDIIRAHATRTDAWTLQNLLHDAPGLPGTATLQDALTGMKRGRVHALVVTDEFGGTAGIVTLADLLQRIVGESTATSSGRAPQVLPGTLGVEAFAAQYTLRLDDSEADTLGGYFVEQLGRNARIGDELRVDRVVLVCERVNGPYPADVRVLEDTT